MRLYRISFPAKLLSLVTLAVDEDSHGGGDVAANKDRTEDVFVEVDEKESAQQDDEGENESHPLTSILASYISFNIDCLKMLAMLGLSLSGTNDPFGTAGEGLVVLCEDFGGRKWSAPSHCLKARV